MVRWYCFTCTICHLNIIESQGQWEWYVHTLLHRATFEFILDVPIQGAYHTGVEIAGREYSFSMEGISAGLPKRCPAGVTYHSQIEMGRTSKNVHSTITSLRSRFPRGSYDILTKNCNVFSEALCKELVGKSIPSWINRLARTGNKIDSGKPASSATTTTKEKRTDDAPLSTERNTISNKQKALLEKMKRKKKTKKKRKNRV